MQHCFYLTDNIRVILWEEEINTLREIVEELKEHEGDGYSDTIQEFIETVEKAYQEFYKLEAYNYEMVHKGRVSS